MSVKLMSAIFETEFRDLPTGETNQEGKMCMSKASSMKVMLLAIADHANDDGESAYPGYVRLMRKTGLSRQGVADVLKALRYNGIIFVSDNPSRLNTNDYTINLSCFPNISQKDDFSLVVKPLDQSSHLTDGSQVTLPEPVKPLDLKHQLNTIKPSIAANAAKPDMVDFELSKLPAVSIRKAVSDYFRLNVNWDTKMARQWMEWATGEGMTAAQIEKAAQLWKTDKRFNWQQPSLKGIFEKWQMLMDAAQNNYDAPRGL